MSFKKSNLSKWIWLEIFKVFIRQFIWFFIVFLKEFSTSIGYVWCCCEFNSFNIAVYIDNTPKRLTYIHMLAKVMFFPIQNIKSSSRKFDWLIWEFIFFKIKQRTLDYSRMWWWYLELEFRRYVWGKMFLFFDKDWAMQICISHFFEANWDWIE